MANDTTSGPNLRSKYITALYFTFTILSSVGFGNVAPFGSGCCVVNAQTRDMSGDADIFRMRTTFKFNRPEPAAEPMK